MTAGHATHAWSRGDEGRRPALVDGWRGAAGVSAIREIDDALAVLSWTRDAQCGSLADQEAVARTTDVLLASRWIPNRSRFVAAFALDHVLLPFARDVDARATHVARDFRSDARHDRRVGRRLLRRLVSLLLASCASVAGSLTEIKMTRKVRIRPHIPSRGAFSSMDVMAPRQPGSE